MKGGAAALLPLACAAYAACIPGPVPARAQEADRVHVVRPGETLWQITAALTGDPDRWPELYRANRDQIKDPSTLYPGQRLAIPDFDEPADGAPLALPHATSGAGGQRPTAGERETSADEP